MIKPATRTKRQRNLLPPAPLESSLARASPKMVPNRAALPKKGNLPTPSSTDTATRAHPIKLHNTIGMITQEYPKYNTSAVLTPVTTLEVPTVGSPTTPTRLRPTMEPALLAPSAPAIPTATPQAAICSQSIFKWWAPLLLHFLLPQVPSKPLK